jgi:23S rRNA pseudouridine1911/1915/1917 synthase
VFISSLKKKYNLSKDELEEKPILSRMALHAHRLVFKTENGATIEVEAPMTKDMNAMLKQCRKWLK